MSLQGDYKFRRSFKQGVPSNDEGYDGEVSLRLTQSGVVLFGKIRGVWYILGRGVSQSGQAGTGGQQDQDGFPANIQLNDTFTLDKNVIKVNSSKSKTKDDAIKLNANSNVAGKLKVDGDLTVSGIEAGTANIILQADEADDAGDEWKITANTDQSLKIGNDIASDGNFVSQVNIVPNATATSSVLASAGNIKVGGNVIQASDGGSTITMDTSDNVTIAGNLQVGGNRILASDGGATIILDTSDNVSVTGNLSTTEITAGAVIWQYFPFQAQAITNGRMHYSDVDDIARYRLWDDYDTDPTGFDYRDVAGQFVVPENCTLKGMHGVVLNNSSTNNPDIGIYHGTVTESTSDTTLALAGGAGGGAKNINITTMRVPYKFSDTFDVDLDAGDIVVPTISHSDSGGTRTFVGTITLKFVTR